MERKYLKITEYSSLLRDKIPIKESNEFDLEHDGDIIRTSIIKHDDNIMRSMQDEMTNGLDSLHNEAKFCEKSVPLDKVIILDDVDMANENQKLAYVFECPICLHTTMTTTPNLTFCPYCENTKFPPKVIALMNVAQLEDLVTEEDDVTTFVQVKDGKVIYQDMPKNDEKDIFHQY